MATYLDIATKRQAILERLKTGMVDNFTKELKNLEKLIRQTLLGLEQEIGETARTKLNALLSQLRSDQGEVFKKATETFINDTAKVAAVYSAQEIIDLKETVDFRGTKLKAFTNKELFDRVINRPLTTNGDLLQPWIKKFSETEIDRVNNKIRAGWAQGKTNQQLVQEIIGTKAKRYKDGVLETTRRNASTVVRTSVQHVASAARQETWEANQDVVKQYSWLSTLDTVTSKQCRFLDGQKFEFGKGPVPPIHPNCRSTTIPVLDPKFDFLSKGRTRSAEDGPVSAKQSYYDWLKKQDPATQDQVLGKTRAKLFRDGGLSAERFRALQFDKNFEPLTLDEMAKLEPAAFQRAGLIEAPAKPPRKKATPKPKTAKSEKTLADIEREFEEKTGVPASYKGLRAQEAERISSHIEKLTQEYNHELRGVYVSSKGDNSYAVNSHYPGDDASVIKMNKKWFSDPENFEISLRNDVKKKYHPDKCDTLESVLTHEFGHTLTSNQINPKNPQRGAFFREFESIIIENTRRQNELVGRWIKGEIDQKEYERLNEDFLISGYARKNNAEFIAEGFASYKHNPKGASTISREIGQLVDKYFKKETPGKTERKQKRFLIDKFYDEQKE